MRIHFLGTASGLPTERRFSQTTVVEHGDHLHILDVADGASALLLRQGLNHRALRSVTISHMHADHHSGLAQLLKTCMHLGRREPMYIYMPGEAIMSYRAFLDLCYLPCEWLGFPVEWVAIDPATKLELGDGLTVQAFANDHLAHARKRAMTMQRTPATWHFESYSFMLQAAPYTVAYTGNLRASLAEMRPWCNGVDVLISELAHVAANDSIDVLRQMQPRVALFAHVGPQHDAGCPDLEEARLPGVQVYVAEDGDCYDIGALLGGSVDRPDKVAQ